VGRANYQTSVVQVSSLRCWCSTRMCVGAMRLTSTRTRAPTSASPTLSGCCFSASRAWPGALSQVGAGEETSEGGVFAVWGIRSIRLRCRVWGLGFRVSSVTYSRYSQHRQFHQAGWKGLCPSKGQLTQEEYDAAYIEVWTTRKFKEESDAELRDKAQSMLDELKEMKTQSSLLGCDNVSIVKPAAKSQGRDITCIRSINRHLEYIDGRVGVGTPRRGPGVISNQSDQLVGNENSANAAGWARRGRRRPTSCATSRRRKSARRSSARPLARQ
jgi:hypothetical protein